MPSSYYKIGTDVYGTEEGKLSLDQFQNLGLNFNLLGEGAGNATALDSGQDVETRSFISGGGQLGGASAAQQAGYTFDPTTGQLTTPQGTGSFGAGSVPTTQAIGTATQTLADKLKTEGAVSTSELPSEQSQFLKNMEDRLKKSDDQVSQLMSLYAPTAQEQKIQADIDTTFGAAEQGILEEADRPATMGFISGAQASIERRANAKLAGLQRELTRLQGNRTGQRDAIKAAYDIKRQSAADALAFYQATAPDQITVDERSGTVYFRNPITGQVTATKLPGFQTKKDKPATTSDITEYQYAKEQGYKGSFQDYMTLKATKFGTEKDKPSDKEEKIVNEFNKDLSSWNLAGTREQFIRQLQARYPQIDANDIARKVYEIYPNGYDK